MQEIIGKLITPQEGEVSPLFLQLVVACALFNILKGMGRVISAKVYRQPGCRSWGKYAFVCVYVFVLYLFCGYKFSLFL